MDIDVWCVRTGIIIQDFVQDIKYGVKPMSKRFKTNYVGCIVDYEDNLKNYDGEEITDLLNKLAEENKQLKNRIKLFQKLAEPTNNLKTCHIEEENKQIKEILKDIVRKLDATISPKHPLYSVTTIVDIKTFHRIKELVKND